MLVLFKLNCLITLNCLELNLTFLATTLLIVLLTIFVTEINYSNEKPNKSRTCQTRFNTSSIS